MYADTNMVLLHLHPADCMLLCQEEYNLTPEISELLCMECTLGKGREGGLDKQWSNAT